MKSDATLTLVLVLGGLAAWYLFSRQGVPLTRKQPPEATTQRALMELIGSLPMVQPTGKGGYKPYDPNKIDVGFVQGTVTGAGYGSVAGPWGAAAGAAGGAVASFFV